MAKIVLVLTLPYNACQTANMRESKKQSIVEAAHFWGFSVESPTDKEIRVWEEPNGAKLRKHFTARRLSELEAEGVEIRWTISP